MAELSKILLTKHSRRQIKQQSAQSLKILRQNDVGAANDKQAAYLLSELGRKFDEQNVMLQKIYDKLEVLVNADH